MTPASALDFRILAALLVGALLVTAFLIWRGERQSAPKLGAGILVVGALWLGGAALELNTLAAPAKAVWSLMQWLAVVAIVPLWYVYARLSIGQPVARTWRAVLVLAGMPILTLLLAASNPLHQLLRRSDGFTPTGGQLLMDAPHGPWGWVFLAYTFGLVAAGTAVLVARLWRGLPGTRQIVMLLASAWTPLVAIAAARVATVEGSALALTALLFAAVSLAAGWVTLLIRRQTVVPLARRSVLETLHTGVLVVSPAGRIADANAQAGRLFMSSPRELIGQPITEFLPGIDLAALTNGAGCGEVEVTIGNEPHVCICDAQISRLTDWRGGLLGYTIVLHDVTVRWYGEERLERSYQELEFLSETAMRLAEFPADEDIYQYIADRLRQLVGRCIVSVELYDPTSNVLRLQAVAGDEAYQDLFAQQPWKSLLPGLWEQVKRVEYQVPKAGACNLLAGRLTPIANSVQQLGFGQLPASVIPLIEQLLDLGSAYVMGFVRNGELVADCLIVLRRGEVLTNPDVVETLINQASVALQRKRAEDQIRASLAEKEVLLKEINHRVKNNLQVVSSLLHLQSQTVADPLLVGVLEDSRNRIRSMALVHEKLYRSSDLAHIDLCDYMRSLSINLFRSYCPTPDAIRFESTVEDVQLDIDKAVPCGLIVNELLTNALKYAFTGPRVSNEPPTIWLRLYRDNDLLRLKVGDNGVGLPEAVDLATTHSLGLQLVRTLARQLDGTVELKRDSKTEFVISFALPQG